MKKQLILSVLLTLSTFLIGYSQDQKMFGGLDLLFNSSKVKDGPKATLFGLAPTFGYWLNDRSAIVARVSYASGDIADVKSNSFGIGVDYRYGWNVSDNVYLYLAPGVSFTSSKDDIDEPTETTTTDLNIGISPGIQYKFANKWSFVTEFGDLSYNSSKVKDGPEASGFGLNLLMSTLNFGLQYHF